MKNKFMFLWVYNDIPYELCKVGFMGISFSAASAMSYPLYYVKEMVDVWPKERGGNCTWNNNYRQCIKWMVENMDTHYFNYLREYSLWFKRYGILYLIGFWISDSIGMHSNCNEAYNSLETQFPNFSESV